MNAQFADVSRDWNDWMPWLIVCGGFALALGVPTVMNWCRDWVIQRKNRDSDN